MKKKRRLLCIGSILMIGIVLSIKCTYPFAGNRMQISETSGKSQSVKHMRTSNRGYDPQFQDKQGEGRWLCYVSRACEQLDKETKERLDGWVKDWTNGKFADDELTEIMTKSVRDKHLPIHTAGILSRQICLFEDEDEIPDYAARIRNTDGIYDFIGLYTKDDVDQEGNLICYFWEAGIR